jgi:ketosteroid isomerase-like protein
VFDPAIKWSSPDTVRFGGHFNGVAGVGGFFASLPENFAELYVQPLALLDSGDAVAVSGRLHGRTAAGNAFDIPFVHLWTFSGGKATSFPEQFDTVRMNAALSD